MQTSTGPRDTEFWQETTRIAGEALVSALTHPEVAPHWVKAVEAVGDFVDGVSSETQFEAALAALEAAVRQHGNAIADLYGPYLRQLLDTLAAEELFTLRGDAEHAKQVAEIFFPKKIWRLRPDNPIELASDGRSASAIETAKRVHVLQLHSYFESLRPAGRIGRPPGTRTKGPTRARLDPEFARRALELHEAGAEWPQIAREVLGVSTYGDQREREQQRKRVARLVERGRLDRDASRPDGEN